MFFNSNGWKRFSFGLWSPIYDRAVKAFDRSRRHSLEVLDPVPDERVLIVGAGTGLDLECLPSNLDITAVDLTPAMVRRLESRARRLGVSVDARVMDGHALQFPDGYFDAVILHLIIAVIPDPARCLREVHRVLRNDGRAVVMDKFIADASRPHPILRIAGIFAELLGTNLTRKLGPLVEQSGLQITHLEPAALDGYFKIALLKKVNGRPSQPVR